MSDSAPTNDGMSAEVAGFITPLLEGAYMLHELYCAYQKAGFSSEHSFELIRTMLESIVRGQAK